MKGKNGVLSIGVIGMIIIVFTLAAFFLLKIERVAINVWALAFLLLSECVLFGGLIALRFHSARHSKVFLRAGVATALSLYFGATLISVFFVRLLKERLYTFILIELAIIALFAIVAVAALAFSRGVARRNEADAAKVGTTEPKRGGF